MKTKRSKAMVRSLPLVAIVKIVEELLDSLQPEVIYTHPGEKKA
jgi:hypothetical protein